VRGKTAQRLLFGRGWGGEVVCGFDWRFGFVKLCGAWGCAVTTLTPRPPLPPAGEGEKRALARKGAMGYGLNDFHDRFAMVDLEAFATGYLKLA